MVRFIVLAIRFALHRFPHRHGCDGACT
jgi:hypothetical protein